MPRAGVLILFLCMALPAPAEDSGYEEWRRQRLESLQKPDGWLTLAGLFWLSPGDNSFGSGPGNDIVFPGGPERMGVMRLQGNTVEVLPEPGLGLEQQTIDTTEKEGSTVLRHGTLSWFFLRRHGKVGLRLKDSASRVRTEFPGIDTFPENPAWRLVGRFEPSTGTLDVTDVTGGTSPQDSPGWVVLEIQGQSYRLALLEDYFLVFADATSGDTTYSVGRFVYAQAPDAEGRMVVDFNRAYLPPCAFTPYATCPLPPKENMLPLRVEAGEKNLRR